MDDDTKKIRINVVQGGDSRDQQALKRNYFYPTGDNTYEFFDPGDDRIDTTPPVLVTGENFSFTLKEMPDVTWTISNFDINAQIATGNWTNTHKIELDEGEFHAQAGGGAEEDTSSAAAG